ncbi:MAG: VPLPA-CTERM sorting domain-containing protein [Porticoccaceae bacterium]|nr:VPLPA-CTERM sorting domain-containing protein [Porticoccaceae bacterium]
MNRNLSKLLQSLAGAVVLSMASLSMAATYTYDFDADNDERGGQPLNFGDLNVYGGLLVDGGPMVRPSLLRGNAYLDAGSKSGLGVCREKVDNSAGGGSPSANKCFTAGGGYAGSDDNLQINEVLGFVFDASKKISEVGIWGKHDNVPDGTKVLIWTDTGGFDLLDVIADKITLDFELTQMAIFGSMSDWYKGFMKKNFDIGTTNTDALYVAGINEVPIPAAVWLFGSALLGLAGLRRRKVAV